MIVKLKATNIFAVLSTIAAITSVVKVFSEEPQDQLVPDTAYMYPAYTNDVTSTYSNQGSLIKQLSATLNIVASTDPATNASNELDDIIDAITNAIVNEECAKIGDWDGVTVTMVTEETQSPIGYNIKNRAITAKNYLFVYDAK